MSFEISIILMQNKRMTADYWYKNGITGDSIAPLSQLLTVQLSNTVDKDISENVHMIFYPKG